MSAEHSHHERRNLDKAFVKGVAWTAGAKWLSQLLSWPAVLICARFLSPADFGIVEMAGFYFIVTNVVAEFGVGMAVLQMRELDKAVVAQLNSVALLSGTFVFGFSVLASPLIAEFFRTPQLRILVIFASFLFILTSFEAIPLGLLQRDMDYRRLSIGESVQAIVTAIVSIGCALMGFGYWSIAWGNMLGRVANVSLTVYWRPTPFAIPRRHEVMKPLHFGMEIAVQRIVGAIGNLSDGMVIGRMLGQAPLGVFRLASNLASTPAEKIGTLIMRVTGPLFARVQADKALLRRYFLIFTESLAMAIFPLLFGLATVSRDAVHVLLGPQWSGAASPLTWLSIFMSVRTLISLLNQMATTLRFTRFGMWMVIISFTLMPVSFWYASRWGVGAVAAAWLVMSPVTAIPIAVKVLGAIECSWAQYVKCLMPALTGSAVMYLAILALRLWPAPQHWLVGARLAIEVAVGGIAYAGLLWGFYRQRILQYVRFFKDLRGPGVTA